MQDSQSVELLKAQFEHNWQRFLESLTPDLFPLTMLRDTRPELSYVWQCSEFIASSCIACPQIMDNLVKQNLLEQAYQKGDYLTQVKSLTEKGLDEQAFMQSLRQFRRTQMIRIAWRDLAKYASLEETLLAVSELAQCAIQAAYTFAWQQLQPRFGEPCLDGGEVASMVVLGMGKLGGQELNYSSDVDLIFAYDYVGETNGDKSVSNQEFFTKLGRKIIHYLDTMTEDGFVFRTDMRLRPNGESGPLVLSFAAMEHYYQIHGRSWERYAFIKARVVAGNPDKGQELLTLLKPFVYRKYIDYSAFSSIRDMKQLIEQGLTRRKNSQWDIKLGRGGIREIEFFIQSFQLIRGGREPSLQTESLYQAYQAAVKLKLLDDKTVAEMLDSYEFLRDLEHRLQMAHDRQTQLLPQDEIERARIAKAMQVGSWDSLLTMVMQHFDTVHRHFQTILQTDNTEQSALSSDRLKQMQLVWRQASNQDVIPVLQEQGYEQAEATQQILSGFLVSRLYDAYSATEKDRLDQLMPLVLLDAVQLNQPNRALSRFITVLEGIARRSVYFLLLIENPIALTQLLKLCAASDWMANYIGQYPVVLDELLHPIAHEGNEGEIDYKQQLGIRLQKLPDWDDEEAFMDELREFQRAAVLHLAALDISGLLDSRAVEIRLSQIAEAILEQALVQAKRLTAKRLAVAEAEIAIVAYGKFAGKELGYNSDLDLVLLYQMDDPECSSEKKSEAEFFFARMTRKFLNILNAQTRLGRLYELDMRLRPSGSSGTLVTTLGGFHEYQLNQAWTWEHQSLVRTRVVIGSSAFRANFNKVRAHILQLPREKQSLAQDVAKMRQKMVETNCKSDQTVFDLKLDWGGIVDIEFLVQYWVLLYASEQPSLLDKVAIDEILDSLAENHLIDAKIAFRLSEIYRSYLEQSLAYKLTEQSVLIAQNELLNERAFVKNIWRKTFTLAPIQAQ